MTAGILEFAFDVAKHIFNAITSGDEDQWKPIADILPDPLKTRMMILAEDEKTRQEIEKILSMKKS
jgi:hypothetical protein